MSMIYHCLDYTYTHVRPVQFCISIVIRYYYKRRIRAVVLVYINDFAFIRVVYGLRLLNLRSEQDFVPLYFIIVTYYYHQVPRRPFIV